jgi:3-methyladenine DNA glycosylase/8-oxoguanine DNA glycosylase
VREYTRLAELHGERTALGVSFPSAARVAKMPTWEIERVGVDKKRARAIIQLAREEQFRSFLSSLTSHAEMRRRLLAVRGIGPWTTDMTLGFGAGDTDALPLGDLHLPHLVSWIFDRKPRGTDERMVELLEPYRGQRFQVVRLLLSGRVSVPRM